MLDIAEAPVSSLDTLKEIGPIHYSGAPGEEALYQYLRTHGYISGCYLLVVGVTMTLVLLPLSLMISGVLLVLSDHKKIDQH